MYCWQAAKRSWSLNYCCFANEWVLFFAMPFLAHKGFALTGRLKTAKCKCLWSSAPCQVRMFLRQLNRWLQQLLAVENKTILQQPKPSTLSMMFHVTQIFYPHHIGMCSQMLYTNGLFEICQERMFVKQRRKDGWSIYLLPKKNICSNSVKKFLSKYLCTLHWHAFTNALR